MREALTIFTEYLGTLSDLFYPSHCVGCGIALFEKSRFCRACWAHLERVSEHCCQVCSYEMNASSASSCENCADRHLHFVTGVSAFRYRGLVRDLLFQLKYAGDQSLKKALGELMAIALQDQRICHLRFEAVIPVPLHALREREREFNQARLLAKEVANVLACPMRDLLCRIKPTMAQVSSDRKKRIQNLQGAFGLKKKRLLSGNYLLVDDVLTTGSTLDACAQVLLQAGAGAVWGVTMARS